MTVSTSPPVSLDIQAIFRHLPQRYPFLMIDKVEGLEPGEFIVAVKNVSINEHFFQGHFPGNPIMPGVLILEAMAQATGILALSEHPPQGRPEDLLYLFVGIDDARFKRRVVPGDQLRIEAHVKGRKLNIWKCEVTAKVDGEEVCSAMLTGVGERQARSKIDPRALVDPLAKLAEDVHVGAWTVIGPEVEIGAGTVIGPHVVLQGPMRIGQDNKILQYASVGGDPQDKKYGGEPTRLLIGDRNVIREFVTINRGTVQGGGATVIGDDNLFMACTHIAHDCHIGHHTTFANYAALSGHVVVEDHAIVSAYSAVHQFCHIGQHSFIAPGTLVRHDVLPFVLVQGETAQSCGLNLEGLKRHGFCEETVRALGRAYRIIFRKGRKVKEAQAELAALQIACPEVGVMVEALLRSTRGIVR